METTDALAKPLNDDEFVELGELLAEMPDPFSPMEADRMDGYLTAIALLPERIPPSKWMPFIFDETDGNNYYISSIEYGFDDSGTPAGKIQFSYSPDTFYYPKYFAGIERQFKRVLNSISSYNGTEEICRYTLHHNTINDDLMLTGIACKCDGKQLNPNRF